MGEVTIRKIRSDTGQVLIVVYHYGTLQKRRKLETGDVGCLTLGVLW